MVFEYLGNTGTTAVQLFATDGHNACRASVLRSSPVYNVHGPIWWSFSQAIAALVSVVFCHSSWVFTPWRRRWSPGDSRWDSFHWLQRTFGAVSDLHSCLWTCCCSHLSGWVELVVFCSVLQVSNLEYPVCVPNLKFSIMTWKQSSRQIWFVFSNPESTKSFKCSYGWNRKISSINFTHTHCTDDILIWALVKTKNGFECCSPWLSTLLHKTQWTLVPTMKTEDLNILLGFSSLSLPYDDFLRCIGHPSSSPKCEECWVNVAVACAFVVTCFWSIIVCHPKIDLTRDGWRHCLL